MKSTMVELIPELEKLTKCKTRELLIQEALNGEFHDFKNEKYVCGKMELVNIMTGWIALFPQDKEQATKIKNDVIDGVYDEIADEGDEEKMRKDILANSNNENEAHALMKIIGL